MQYAWQDSLRNMSKKQLIKWGVFLALLYGFYDCVYLAADTRRLMLDMADVSSKLLPKIALNIDVPLFIGVLVICLVFDKHRFVLALGFSKMTQILFLAFGSIVFIGAVFINAPSGILGGYEVLRALLIGSILQELAFRGLFFRWLEEAGVGVFAYLISGLAWGALLGIEAMVSSGMGALIAIAPRALFGVVVGSAIAFIYKKTDSLWFVIYLHAAVILL